MVSGKCRRRRHVHMADVAGLVDWLTDRERDRRDSNNANESGTTIERVVSARIKTL